MTATSHLLYGTPPVALVALPPASVQHSPLVPNAPALEDLAPDSLQSAVVYAPQGTLERRYVLAQTLRALKADASFTVLAPNDKGGNRLAAELSHFGCAVHTESKQHHRICSGFRPAQLMEVGTAIAAGAPQHYAAHGLWTQPGVFSWDRIDAGSALLLQHLLPLSGAGADLGCGLGVLSRAVLTSAAVTSLLLVDIDGRAIACARKNISDTRAAFLWADMREGLPPAPPLDFVVMNPPFHSSGVEDKALGQMFITRAAALLKKGGQCWLTANKHLPYEQLLAQYFSQVQLVDTAEGFKIYRAEK